MLYYIKYIIFHLQRLKRLKPFIKQYGLSSGFWMWKIENNLTVDYTGDWFIGVTDQMKIQATQARWHNNEELADGITDFISDMETYHRECHPNLYNENE